MNTFRILDGPSLFINPKNNQRELGIFLMKQVQAYCHADYHGGNKVLRETSGTVENIITTLKTRLKIRAQKTYFKPITG